MKWSHRALTYQNVLSQNTSILTGTICTLYKAANISEMIGNYGRNLKEIVTAMYRITPSRST